MGAQSSVVHVFVPNEDPNTPPHFVSVPPPSDSDVAQRLEPQSISIMRSDYAPSVMEAKLPSSIRNELNDRRLHMRAYAPC